LLACQSKRRTDAEAIVREWTGKEIRFPELTGDTARVLDSLLTKEYKVLFYVDSTGCTSCRLNLGMWDFLIKESKEVLDKHQIGFLFFFQSKNLQDIPALLHAESFKHPVFIDLQNRINTLNGFPVQSQYQSFLLDKDNKVLMIGNPADQPVIWDLYKTVIESEERK
jgi:hypothetical protein